MQNQIGGHDQGEEFIDLNNLIYYECNKKVKHDAIISHNCFKDVENVYFSGGYVTKTAMLHDNSASQTVAESENENDDNLADENEDNDINFSLKSVLWNSKAVKCLLDLYPKYKNLFDKRKII